MATKPKPLLRSDLGTFAVKFDPDVIWPVILTEIANGSSLAAVLRREGFPGYEWAKRHLRENPELRRDYELAIETRADFLAEQIVDLADSPMPEGLDSVAAGVWIRQLAIRVDSRKWTSSVLRPRVYGSRIDVTVENRISITAALAAANRRLENAYNDEIDITPLPDTEHDS